MTPDLPARPGSRLDPWIDSYAQRAVGMRASEIRALFAVASGFSMIGLVLAWTLPEAPRQHAAQTSTFSMPRMLAVALGATWFCGIAFGSVMTFVPTFAQDEHLGPVAVFFLSYTSMAIATRLWAGRLADDFGLRRMILPGTALLSLAILGLSEVWSVWTLLAAGLVFGLAQGITYPTINAFSVDLAGPGQLGRVQAFYNGTFNVGVTAAGFTLGPVVHAFGHRAMFECASGAALIAFVLFLFGTREPALAHGAR